LSVLRERRQLGQGQFLLQELHVKRCVVDDQFRAAYVLYEFRRNFPKPGLVQQELIADAVHSHRPLFAGALRIEIVMEVIIGGTAIEQLEAADFDYPVAQFGVQPGGLRIKNDLAHHFSPASRAVALETGI
jgi:hypothetical protein